MQITTNEAELEYVSRMFDSTGPQCLIDFVPMEVP